MNKGIYIISVALLVVSVIIVFGGEEPTYGELVQRVIALENQSCDSRLSVLEQWRITIQNTVDAIDIQLETVKEWLFFWDWQGVDETVCDAIMNECQEVCVDECHEGEIGCLDEDTRWDCEQDGCCYKIYEDCDEGEICEDGVCCSVECYDDLDCPDDIIEYYCDNNDVYKRTTSYDCIDAGTCDSYCDENVDETLIDDCDDATETCRDGGCVPIAPDACDVGDKWKICGESGCYGTTVCINGFWTDCSSDGLSCGDGGTCNARGICVGGAGPS